MQAVTDKTFATAVLDRSRDVTVVVDLWASWCAPCRMLSPILERVAAETPDTVELVAVDVDRNQRTAQAMGVQSIPAVMAFRDGEVVDSFVGARSERYVRKFLRRVSGGK